MAAPCAGVVLLWKVKVKVAKLCLTLCDPIDYIVYGILQVRILQWVAFPFSRVSSQPRDWTQVSTLQADSSPAEPLGKPYSLMVTSHSQAPFSPVYCCCGCSAILPDPCSPSEDSGEWPFIPFPLMQWSWQTDSTFHKTNKLHLNGTGRSIPGGRNTWLGSDIIIQNSFNILPSGHQKFYKSENSIKKHPVTRCLGAGPCIPVCTQNREIRRQLPE